MESLTKNRQTIAQIEAMMHYIMTCSVAPSPDAIQELKEGWFNVAYDVQLTDGRSVILKIAPPPQADVMSYERDLMRNEVHWMRFAHDHGIPCPKVYGYDDRHILCDADYFVMEKLTGDNFAHIQSQLSTDQLRAIHGDIGRTVARWNHLRLSADLFGYWHRPELQASTWKDAFLHMVQAVLRDGQAKQVDLGVSYDDVSHWFLMHADALLEVTTPALVHWDCWDNNVFVEHGQFQGVLDFERAFVGDVLAEAQFRMRNPDQLKGYGKTTFTAKEQVRCTLYDAYLSLIMNIEHSYRHYDTEEIRSWGYHGFLRAYQSLPVSKQ